MKPVPWTWVARMAVVLASVILFDASNEAPDGWTSGWKWRLLIFGVATATTVVFDLTLWSYRKAQREAKP